jgi:hypothetical protein
LANGDRSSCGPVDTDGTCRSRVLQHLEFKGALECPAYSVVSFYIVIQAQSELYRRSFAKLKFRRRAIAIE